MFSLTFIVAYFIFVIAYSILLALSSDAAKLVNMGMILLEKSIKRGI